MILMMSFCGAMAAARWVLAPGLLMAILVAVEAPCGVFPVKVWLREGDLASCFHHSVAE